MRIKGNFEGALKLKDKKKKQVFPIDEDALGMGVVVSSTECTGLMPTPPLSEQDEQSYTDIYDIPQPGNNPLNDKEKTKPS